MHYLDELNQEQQRAVTTIDRPLVIIAGPGTGKTKTLTARITYLLLEKKVKPEEILALTFTKKAAEEMRNRVEHALDDRNVPLITTFHAFCHQLLNPRDQPLRFITDHERMILISQLHKSVELKTMTSRELGLAISRLKNQPSHIPIGDLALQKLLLAYNHALAESGLCDFDDLLQETYKLLSTLKVTLPYTYILIDEYQDTNPLQYELLRLLNVHNMCVIGDPLQSIYSFRGATSNIFDRFKLDYPDYEQIILSHNYRSAKAIVSLTNAIFPHSPQLTAMTSTPGFVQSIEVLNEYSEAEWIIRHIESAIGGSDFLRSQQYYNHPEAVRTFGDFAILYRTHNVGRVIQRTLEESGIPFQIVGDGSLYQQPVIWAMLQIMRFCAHPNAERENDLAHVPALKKFSPAALHTLLLKLIDNLPQKISDIARTISTMLDLQSPSLHQFVATLVRFDSETLQTYITYIDTITETSFYQPEVVSLMTIHAAKGLEFSHVFLIGVEEEILPHFRPGQPENIIEEKHLFYVAASRAKEQLDILYTRTRRGQASNMSRFLTEFEPSILPRKQDEAMQYQKRRLEKRKIKRSQTSLFDL